MIDLERIKGRLGGVTLPPWESYHFLIRKSAGELDEDGVPLSITIGTVIDHAHADLVVCAVNNLAALIGEVEELRKQRDVAMRACEAIATDEREDPCHYDHHGLCQAHGLQPKGECYMELARAALKMIEEATS